jgi:hypothetical protein
MARIFTRKAQWFERRHGSFDPTAITPLDLVEDRGYLQANGGKRTTAYPEGQLAAPATVNRALVSLSRFCQSKKFAVCGNQQTHHFLVTNDPLRVHPTVQVILHWQFPKLS